MAVPTCPDHRNWKSLYRAAILEKDTSVITEKISRAEEAIVVRARELFYKGGPREERNAVDHALHALHAYKAAREHADAA